MADIKYSVEVAYFSSGNIKSPFAAGGSASPEKAFKGYDKGVNIFARDMSRAFSGVVDGFSSALIGAASSAASSVGGMLSQGISASLKTGIGFADQMERTQIALATMQHMHLDMSFEGGMRNAATLMEQARKDAASLPGEFKDVVSVMKTLAAPGLQSGMSMEAIEKMSAKTVAMAEVEGVSSKVAASQLAMMLEGRMTNRQSFGRRMGFEAKSFNKLAPEERVKQVNASLAKADPAIEAYKHSWAGLTSNVRDQLRNVAKSFATPLYESMKTSMGSGLAWFGAHEAQVHAVAYGLGSRLRAAFEWGSKEMLHWGPIVFNFTERLYQEFVRIFGMLEPYLKQAGAGLEKFLGDPNSIKKLEHAAELLAGLMLGGKALAGIGSMASMLMPLIGATGATGAAAFAAAAGPVALAAAAIGVAGLGIAEGLNETNSATKDAMLWSISNIKKYIEGSAKAWGDVYESAVKPALEQVGLGMLELAEGLAALVMHIGQLTSAIISEYGKFGKGLAYEWGINDRDQANLAPGQTYDTATGKYRKLKPGETQGTMETTGSWWDYLKYSIKQGPDPHTYMMGDTNEQERGYEGPVMPKLLAAIEEGVAKKKPPTSTTHIHNVEIKVMGNYDPNRAAKATARELIDIMRHPKVSREALSNRTVR